jgi:PAS domain S-box-containing protein
MIGQSILRIIPPDRHQEEDRILSELRRGQRVENYESVRLCKDGRRVDVSLTVFPISDESGRPVAAAKIARDISARKRGEEELRRREADYRTLFDAAGTDNAEVELDTGRFVRVNRKFCELVGYDADKLLGAMTVVDLVHPDDRQGGVATDMLLHDGRPSFDVEKRYVRKDGGTIWVHLTATALHDEGGRPLRSLRSVIDMTQRKAAEAALRKQARRKDEFLATLAHELRNPLALVRNAVQLMKTKGAGEAETTWARDVINRQVECMARLIDDLLDVSRITLGKVELHLEPIDLAKVLLDAVETSRPLIGADAHQLTVTLPPEPVVVMADTTRLSQVFANLLNNAAKFTARGGRIVLRAERVGDAAAIGVTDNGIGIPQDKLASIFELFTQVRSDANDPKGGGLGIGLRLARRLVEMHGGTVDAKSAGTGEGSTFTVYLPLATRPAGAPTDGADTGNMSGDLVRGRVLMVDDNRDAVASLSILLELAGNTVRMAYDGLEAVQAAATFQPDVILLDIGLPRLNGLDACRRIRALPSGDRIVIVAITGGARTPTACARARPVLTITWSSRSTRRN